MSNLDLSDIVETSPHKSANCVRIWHPEDQPYDFPFGDYPKKDRKCLWVIESPKDFGGFPGTEYLFYSGLDGDTDKLEMEDSIIYFVYERSQTYGKVTSTTDGSFDLGSCNCEDLHWVRSKNP